MKKQTFQGVLCVLAGILVAVFVLACMFKNLHWPGGELLLKVITPLILMVQLVCLSCYVGKFGALKAIEGEGKPFALHLLRTEVAALIVLAVLVLAVMFGALHWPGRAWLVLISCSALEILSILAGIFACRLFARR